MSSTPNWQLLPTSPLAFFELQPGFDRKDLKRAYGKLIKLYKPETHPAEFQRIREAYEALESQQRYGVKQAELASSVSNWDSVFNAPSPAQADARRSSDKAVGQPSDQPAAAAELGNIFEAARTHPLATYKRLAKTAHRTPQDFYILATLSDLVDSGSENMYLKWLLTGVREHPRDPGLLRLLTEYLSAFADAKIASATLFTLSKLVEGGDFYRVTERLWDRLIDEVPFEAFAKSLAACEANLRHRQMRPRLAFTVHLLRKALWKAPAAWIEERVKLIEQHGSEIDSALDEEFEFLNLLKAYVQQDRARLISRPLGANIDRLIAAYCNDRSSSSMAEIAQLCDELARNGNGLMDTFRVECDESDARVLMLCSLIAHDIATETGLEFEPANPQRIERHADSVVADLEKTIHAVSSRLTWLRYRQLGLPFLALWIGPLILTSGMPYWPIFVSGWTVFAVLLFFALIKPQVLEKRIEARAGQLLLREYETLWRPRLFRYVQASHAPAQVAISQLVKSGSDVGQGRLVDLVLHYAFADRAIHLFSHLQQFVH